VDPSVADFGTGGHNEVEERLKQIEEEKRRAEVRGGCQNADPVSVCWTKGYLAAPAGCLQCERQCYKLCISIRGSAVPACKQRSVMHSCFALKVSVQLVVLCMAAVTTVVSRHF
jgi:hypothetical protein